MSHADLPPEEVKSDYIRVRVSSAMRYELERIAELKGDSVSGVVRDLLEISLALWVHSNKISLQDVLKHSLPMIYQTELERIEALCSEQNNPPDRK